MGLYNADHSVAPHPYTVRPGSLLAVLALLVWAILPNRPWFRAPQQRVSALRPYSMTHCSNPLPEDGATCRALEQAILQATVRFKVVWWIPQAEQDGFDDLRRVGHGTILPECRLLTHNHFDVLLPPLSPPDVITDFYFYDAAGNYIGRSTEVTIASAGEESLVLALASDDDSCPLGDLANHPARFAERPSAALDGANEAAQIDWDGTHSFVSWKSIEAVETEDGVECVVLEGPVMLGASGGGVYVGGRYVATTWTRVTYRIAATKEPLPGGQSWAVLHDRQLTQ